MPCPTEIRGGKKLIAPQTHVAIGGAALGGLVVRWSDGAAYAACGRCLICNKSTRQLWRKIFTLPPAAGPLDPSPTPLRDQLLSAFKAMSFFMKLPTSIYLLPNVCPSSCFEY